VGIAFDYGAGVNQLVVADENRNAVHIVKLSATGTVDGIRSVDIGKRPQAIAVNPGRDWALVTSEKDDVFGLTLSSGELNNRADVGKLPRGVVIHTQTCLAVATSSQSNSESVLVAPFNALELLSPAPSCANAAIS